MDIAGGEFQIITEEFLQDIKNSFLIIELHDHYFKDGKEKLRNKKISDLDKKDFIQNLYKIGYSKNFFKGQFRNYKIITSAFQRRFRQELINGLIDQECLSISKNLVKKFK